MAPRRPMTAAVRRSVREAESIIGGLDDAMVALALEYAAALDDARANEDPATYAKRLLMNFSCASSVSTLISTRSAVAPWLLWLVTA